MTPKAFRPISLMSFILKTLEKLIDHRIRSKILINSPLHKFQHAYQPGIGTESALHNLIAEVEKSLPTQRMSLAVFVDIEGAFDNTSFDTITKAARNKGVNECTLKWINTMLKNRLIRSSLDDEEVNYNPTRECPQGGCLSPILWCLVVDSLICQLAKEGLFVTVYADDLSIVVSGNNKLKNEVCRKMNNCATKI
jgi:Reverse transcriptase (RNA-dependent DNA polymerase)